MTSEHYCGSGRCPGCADESAAKALISAVRAISHGDGQPTGIEALVMAIAGEGPPGHDTLLQAIRDAGESVAAGLHAVADAITEASTR